MISLIDENATPSLSWLGASFGPVDPDGYGICYHFNGDHSVSMHISARISSKKTVGTSY